MYTELYHVQFGKECIKIKVCWEHLEWTIKTKFNQNSLGHLTDENVAG
jgi:hypothetical protein